MHGALQRAHDGGYEDFLRKNSNLVVALDVTICDADCEDLDLEEVVDAVRVWRKVKYGVE